VGGDGLEPPTSCV